MSSVRKRSGAWYARWTDAEGRPHERKAGTDKRSAEQLAAALEAEATQVRSGVIDPRALKYRDHERATVSDHLDAFRASIVAKGSSPKHADKTRTRAERVVSLGGVGRLSELTLSRAHTALAALRSEGLSTETLNHHVRAVKGFARWCWKDARTRDHQLVALSTTSPEASRTRTRRALSHDESARLVEAARRGPVVLGMTGPDRATAYRLALATGFRVAELGSLTPESFALDQTPPVVVCEGGYTKNGRKAEQPIPEALADALRPWLATRPGGRPVFALPDRTADMLRADLQAAGIPYETSAGVVDFHALRGAYISNLVSSGASVKTCQTLARHSTPTLTIGVYAKASLHDIAGAVEALPDLTAPRPTGQGGRATGTDGRISKRFAHPLPIAGDGKGRFLSDSDVIALPNERASNGEKTLDPSDTCGDSRSLTPCDGAPRPGGGTADAGDSKSPARKGVWVQIPPRVLATVSDSNRQPPSGATLAALHSRRPVRGSFRQRPPGNDRFRPRRWARGGQRHWPYVDRTYP